MRQRIFAASAVLALFFIFAGDPPPGVNEAHYLVKAKNFWDPDYLANDLFAASGKAHAVFDVLWGWPTRLVSLETTAWIGRLAGWGLLTIGLCRLVETVLGSRWPAPLVAMLWISGITFGNLAGEWVVGGIEAKVPAYGLVLLGLSEIVAGRWRRGWIWMGAASALHVLTGGWSVIAALIGWAFLRVRGRSVPPLFDRGLWIGGGIALFGIVPAAAMSFDGSGSSSTAAMIYVYDRIPHHLLPADFHRWWYIRHAVLIACCVALVGRHRSGDPIWQRLRGVMVGVLAIEATGLLLGMLPAIAPEMAASILKYYWFRISDALLPLLLSLAVVSELASTDGRRRRVAVLASLLCIAGVGGYAWQSFDNIRGGVPVSVQNRLLGWNTQADRAKMMSVWRDWRAVCRWARRSTPPDAVFLTPRHQQTFKWYAARSEVVNWKDVPQDAESLIRWKRRMNEVFPASLGHIKVTINYEALRAMRRRYDARYMIVDHRVVAGPIPLQKVYPIDPSHNSTYAVYDLPRD